MGVPPDVFRIVRPLIKEFEGYYGSRYDDGTGVVTIGYGFIAEDFGGTQNMPLHMSEPEADAKLTQLLNAGYWPPVARLDADLGHPLNPNQLASLLSEVYNLGPGVLEGTHTLGHFLRMRQWQRAANSMLLYSDPNNPTVHAGLLRRREVERKLFLTPWIDPDPHHYEDYPNGLLSYGGASFNERQLAESIDGWLRHPHLHHRDIVKAIPTAILVRKRLWVVSVFAPPDFKTRRPKPVWDEFKRGSRYQWWLHRVQRMQDALK